MSARLTAFRSSRREMFSLQARLILRLFILSALLSVTAAAQQARQRPPDRQDRPPSEAKESIDAKVDRMIEAAMKEKQIPGLVLGIVKRGQVAFKKGYGVRSFESGARPDENTVFCIGSLSKAITAFGVMLLVDEGKLRLDDPASKYLKGLPTRWERITLRQLMTHTSGIPQLAGRPGNFEERLRSADSLPMEFGPGTDQIYNNFNFAVAGQVIQAVSGMKYLDFMKLRVFRPLQMNHTGHGVESRNRATGYELTQGRPEPFPDPPIPEDRHSIPSGHLESTIADLLKFDIAIRQGKLLSPAAYREMMNPVVLPGDKAKASRATPGWFAREAGGVRIIHKNGAAHGFHSDFHFVPDRGDAVILLWNLTGKGSDLRPAVDALMQTVFGIPQAGKMPSTRAGQ